MTKRLNSKHKVDRRLRVNLWGRPKSPFNTRNFPPGQHGAKKSAKPHDVEYAYKNVKQYFIPEGMSEFQSMFKRVYEN